MKIKATLYKIAVGVTVVVLLNTVIAPAITTITAVKSLLSTTIATVFSSTYDTATPAGSDSPTQADDRMREIKAAIQERENVDHNWPLTGTEVSDADAGEHRKVLFHAPIAATPTVAANHGDLRIADVDGKAELHWTDEDEQEIQLTQVGQVCLGRSTAPAPVAQNTTAEDGDGGRETKITAKGTQSGGEVTTLGYIEFAHDGAADDEKGRVSIVVNDGDDADAPSKIGMRWLSPGTIDVTNSVSVLDEDNMASDSAVHLFTQQSGKAYVDNNVGSANWTPTSMTGATDSIGSVTTPNGLILKWGKVTRSGEDTAVDFTDLGLSDFPTACFQAFTVSGTNANIGEPPSTYSLGTDGFTIQQSNAADTTMRWWAVGR